MWKTNVFDICIFSVLKWANLLCRSIMITVLYLCAHWSFFQVLALIMQLNTQTMRKKNKLENNQL